MTTTNGPQGTNFAQHLSMRQEFPEEHIQCVLPGSPGSIEQVYAPGDVIVRSGEVVDILEAESNVITVIMKRWWREGALVAPVLCFDLRQSSWKLGLASC